MLIGVTYHCLIPPAKFYLASPAHSSSSLSNHSSELCPDYAFNHMLFKTVFTSMFTLNLHASN